MSRLDSVIRRLSAQRDVLNHLARNIRLPESGLILELGLGNGRTYHHLRECFPGRRIVAFDRAIAAHGSSIPPEEDLILGEISETAGTFTGRGAALVHADIGTGYPDRDAEISHWLSNLVPPLLAAGGYCASGLPLSHESLTLRPLPEGIEPDRYFLYEKV